MLRNRFNLRSIQLFLLLLFALSHPAYAANSKQVALIIGNSAYQHADLLKHPVSDARLMDTTLKELGFSTTLITDASHREMEESIESFRDQLDEETVGFFYYAGHGLTVGGKNYFIPIDASVSSVADVKHRSISADWVLDSFAVTKNRLNLLAIDAGRSTGFKLENSTSDDPGLVAMSPAHGSVVIHSTQPGSTVAEEAGSNGVFAPRLAEAMRKPGLKLYEIYSGLADAVAAATDQAQIPYWEGGVTGDFYFVPKNENSSAAATDGSIENEVWSSAKDINTAKSYQLYLDKFPDGVFSSLAHLYIERLKREPSDPVVPAGTDTPSTTDIPATGNTPAAEIEPANARFVINAVPAEARIRILNIKPVYQRGMQLKPGQYTVEVTARGYARQIHEVQHGKSETVKNIFLKKQTAQQAQAARSKTPKKIVLANDCKRVSVFRRSNISTFATRNTRKEGNKDIPQGSARRISLSNGKFHVYSKWKGMQIREYNYKTLLYDGLGNLVYSGRDKFDSKEAGDSVLWTSWVSYVPRRDEAVGKWTFVLCESGKLQVYKTFNVVK